MVASNNIAVLQRMLNSPAGDLSQDSARSILGWRFDASDQERLTDLLARNRAGSLSTDESTELDWLLLVGDFLTILQAKAHSALARTTSAA